MAAASRKIIHIDMDAFFASVEQRDNPSLRGRPVAVGGSSGRGVVAAASYEARRFGVRSAMPSATARRLCPDLVFCKSRFDVYREVSGQIRAIFARYTPIIEPPSLDEAYLDVTDACSGGTTATAIARAIRREIAAETRLTASAGVSYNKFLAKLASDQNKPDGLCVIRPGEGADFVQRLPIRRFHGIGPRGEEKMHRLGIRTGADLAARDMVFLRAHFGSAAEYLFRVARGIDLRPVRTHRTRKSVGGERTFGEDLRDEASVRAALATIIDLVWERIARVEARGRTLTLKLKDDDFRLHSRSRSAARPLEDKEDFARLATLLLEQELPLPRPIRLLGLSLSALQDAPTGSRRDAAARAAQLSLF
ncbi:DNA polymerase IV [Qipengyuania thermophila]|uniref:DNA polymerase IV n=1 Tax=Qipengyuania thermophila TaxID=2509361 RepID=UPI001F438CC0|nr:DNA polymerase IV [Qipengyuania thermophila]